MKRLKPNLYNNMIIITFITIIKTAIWSSRIHMGHSICLKKNFNSKNFNLIQNDKQCIVRNSWSLQRKIWLGLESNSSPHACESAALTTRPSGQKSFFNFFKYKNQDPHTANELTAVRYHHYGYLLVVVVSSIASYKRRQPSSYVNAFSKKKGSTLFLFFNKMDENKVGWSHSPPRRRRILKMHPITAFNLINLMLQSSWIVQHSNASPFMRWIDLLVADFAIAHAAEDIFHAGHRVIHQLQSPADDETEIAMKHFVLILFDFVWFCLILFDFVCWCWSNENVYLFVNALAHRFLKLVGPFYFEELHQRFDRDALQSQQEMSSVSSVKKNNNNNKQTNKQQQQQQQQQRRTVSWIHLFRSTSLWRQ